MFLFKGMLCLHVFANMTFVSLVENDDVGSLYSGELRLVEVGNRGRGRRWDRGLHLELGPEFRLAPLSQYATF